MDTIPCQPIFREDGYFNMTYLAEDYGKRLKDFWPSQFVHDYCLELSQTRSFIDSEKDSLRYDLVDESSGESHTWGHPRLIMLLLRWCDPCFALECDQRAFPQVEELTADSAR